MKLISKEGLSEALGLDREKFNHIEVKTVNNSERLYYSNGQTFFNDNVNIHELAHKCKEWAYNKGISLYSASGC